MADEHAIRRYRRWYARLLRLYATPHYERFGKGMEQTFSDRLRGCAAEERGLFGCALWMYADTCAGILRESVIMQKKSLVRIALVTMGILLLPLVGTLFTDGVAWDVSDFVVAGALLVGAGVTYELVAGRKPGNTRYRAAVGVAVASALVFIWVNLAVVIGQ